ncbi:two-component system regulatory protein YycI [Paenisporosarcina quisquiliarum]|uniref:Two-component system regulatory protein YycI n=1 Tax=Paenisporosarcina quisquiliarum TaxID=365346 RepID=A0A9X3LII8_9BACL|nr:two-component system regulatory protein YycI [Paenisporosarcina quisquiliarum]
MGSLDWNKTKTIFIIVFSILNVFLYSLYVDRYKEAQKVEILGETTIEERLQADNIRYESAPENTLKESYVSGNVRVYSPEELKPVENQKYEIFNRTELVATLEKPVALVNLDDSTTFKDFVNKHVFEGMSYELFDVDLEGKKAVFFQTINDRQIYFNQNALLTIYWNEDNEVFKYEQTAFEELDDDFEQTENLLPDERAVEVLYQRNLLKPNSTITKISLGYSTLVQLTETQVFAPTWRVRVELQDGTIEDYFVNAVEGKIIEFNKESEEIEE